ncbi:MAG TPA: hypothetical protein VJ962_10950 [Clostridia bacterium]|nr:hypothetical protein [Clostridia bacterium]
MNKREKVLLLIIIIGFIALFSKSYFLDEVTGLEGQDQVFKNDVNQSIEQTFNQGIIRYRLIDFSTEKREQTIRYTGKIRKYLFGFLPYTTMKIQIDYDLEAIKDES